MRPRAHCLYPLSPLFPRAFERLTSVAAWHTLEKRQTWLCRYSRHLTVLKPAECSLKRS
jgi:hypothetical protein